MRYDFTRPARGVAETAIETLLPPTLHAFYRSHIDRLVVEKTATSLDEMRAGRAIFITTVQLIETLKRADRQPDLYASLCAAISIVLFDEGHYEPARRWSHAIRSLAKPVALLSATPFRNDLRPFVVHKNYFNILHLHEATTKGIIRDVRVVRRRIGKGPEAFCNDTITFCTEQFGTQDKWPRIVIFCDNSANINDVGRHMLARGLAVVAIHDNFVQPNGEQTSSRSGPLSLAQYKNVPPPECNIRNRVDLSVQAARRYRRQSVQSARILQRNAEWTSVCSAGRTHTACSSGRTRQIGLRD